MNPSDALTVDNTISTLASSSSSKNMHTKIHTISVLDHRDNPQMCPMGRNCQKVSIAPNYHSLRFVNHEKPETLLQTVRALERANQQQDEIAESAGNGTK